MKALPLSWDSFWHPPRLRPAIAVLILGSTLAGAAILHGLRLTLAHPSRLKPLPGWNERQNASPVVRLDAKTPNLIVDDDPLLL
jgi:hypothetical protein